MAPEATTAQPVQKPAAMNARRSFWLKQLHQWHWISAAVSLVGLILFAITGITLNHASAIKAEPVVVEKTATLPAPLIARLVDLPAETTDPAPAAVARWLDKEFGANTSGKPTETTDAEVYIDLRGPGASAWVSIDRASGDATYEHTSNGWIAYLNDLHKGRDTGLAWRLFIDVFAVACAVFAFTGLALLWLHSRGRPSTWPIVALGFVIPVILALLFIH